MNKPETQHPHRLRQEQIAVQVAMLDDDRYEVSVTHDTGEMSRGIHENCDRAYASALRAAANKIYKETDKDKE